MSMWMEFSNPDRDDDVLEVDTASVGDDVVEVVAVASSTLMSEEVRERGLQRVRELRELIDRRRVERESTR